MTETALASSAMPDWLTGSGTAAVSALRAVLLRYCRARTSDRTTAEDVAHDVLVALMESARLTPVSAPDDQGLVAYAIGIARNKIADLGRRSSPFAQLDDVTEPVDHSEGPEESVIRRDQAAQVRHLLAQLPAPQAELLLMRSAGVGLSTAAESLGMTTAAASAMQSRALDRLRRLASETSGGPDV